MGQEVKANEEHNLKNKGDGVTVFILPCVKESVNEPSIHLFYPWGQVSSSRS